MSRKKPEPKLDCGVYQCQNRWVVHINGQYFCRQHADTDPKDWSRLARDKLMEPPKKEQWYDEI